MAEDDNVLKDFSFDEMPLDASHLLDSVDASPLDGLPVGSLPVDSLKNAVAEIPADWLERVRVTGPAIMRFAGYEETFAATLVNLSGQGVACMAPTGLTTGDHLHLEFQPSPTQIPQIFLAQVVWTQAVDTEQALYGLRFVQLSVSASETLQTALQEYAKNHPHQQERNDLALDSEDFLSTETSSPTPISPWWWGVAGAAVGALLTSLIMTGLWPQPTTSAPAPALVQQALPVAEPPEALPQKAPAVEATAPTTAVIEKEPPAPAAEVVDTPLPRPLPTPAVAMPSVPPSASKTAAPNKASTVRWRHMHGLDIEEGKHHITLKLSLDGRAGKHQLFWLKSPRRLVVDIAGRQSRLSHKSVEVGHSLVSRVRVGSHPHKVRFVIETGQDVDENVAAHAEGNLFVLQLRRQS